MTHDELLAYIDDSTNGLKHEHLFEKLLANTQALRAVVELHEPIAFDGNKGLFCDKCLPDRYPCHTIQAITREVG